MSSDTTPGTTDSSADAPSRGMHIAATILCALTMLLVELASVHCGTLNFTTASFLVFIALGGVGMWNADLALKASSGTLRTASAQLAGACVLVAGLSPILLTSAMLAGSLH